jgi:V/A-type H+-transporting ATPase subunit A
VTIQVYEETAGVALDDPVEPTAAPMVAWLGPGLLGATMDGLQRPLDRLAAAGTWLLRPGASGGTGERGIRAAMGEVLDLGRLWDFQPSRRAGEAVVPGDVLGEVAEGQLRHRILVPPDAGAGTLLELRAGPSDVAAEIGLLARHDGTMRPLRLAHAWPIRRPRPVNRHLRADRPLLTGMRVIDMLFPVALGGTAVIPGGFGTGKTVVEQSLARWSNADVVVYVGCGERGNEIAELLATFPDLVDPRTGGPLAGRTVLIANTSNMPVAAREASVQLGMTIAEYFRDQGLHVALLADSMSRWAEALREISGRLEELPGEEGFPAYLASRLAALYERSGHVLPIGSPERRGSVTLVGAVSPPGGDFSEPVTQASLRLAGTFWALDAGLAHARHFPAISWTQSYSLYVNALAPSLHAAGGGAWTERRAEALELLARERVLLGIVALVGPDALPIDDRIVLAVAAELRETFLAQHAFDQVDASRPPDVQFALLEAVLAARTGLVRAMEAGAPLDAAVAAPELAELRRAKEWHGPDVVDRLRALASRLAVLRPAQLESPLAGADAPRADAATRDDAPPRADTSGPETAGTAR